MVPGCLTFDLTMVCCEPQRGGGTSLMVLTFGPSLAF